MSPAQRANILNHLAKINHPGLTGIAVREFVKNAAIKTDEEILDCIATLKEQIQTNRPALVRVLGSQFEFIRRFKIPQPC